MKEWVDIAKVQLDTSQKRNDFVMEMCHTLYENEIQALVEMLNELEERYASINRKPSTD